MHIFWSMPRHVNWGGKCPALTVSSCWPSGKPFEGTKPFAPLIRSLTTAEREILGIRRSVLLSGTSTRSAPAGRRPPKPSRQVHTFMKKKHQLIVARLERGALAGRLLHNASEPSLRAATSSQRPRSHLGSSSLGRLPIRVFLASVLQLYRDRGFFLLARLHIGAVASERVAPTASGDEEGPPASRC